MNRNDALAYFDRLIEQGLNRTMARSLVLTHFGIIL